MLEKYPSIPKTILGGFLATLVMTLVWYPVAAATHVPVFDFAAAFGSAFTSGEVRPWTTPWNLGMLEHFVIGSVFFPLIYCYFVYPNVPIYPTLRGLLFAIALWIGSQLLIAPATGMGFFSLDSAKPVLSWFITFNSHLVYGAILGTMVKLSHQITYRDEIVWDDHRTAA